MKFFNIQVCVCVHEPCKFCINNSILSGVYYVKTTICKYPSIYLFFEIFMEHKKLVYVFKWSSDLYTPTNSYIYRYILYVVCMSSYETLWWLAICLYSFCSLSSHQRFHCLSLFTSSLKAAARSTTSLLFLNVIACECCCATKLLVQYNIIVYKLMLKFLCEIVTLYLCICVCAYV